LRALDEVDEAYSRDQVSRSSTPKPCCVLKSRAFRARITCPSLSARYVLDEL
jgi:hypothetical protein